MKASFITLIFSALLYSTASWATISESPCVVKNLGSLNKQAVDIQASAPASFTCDKPIGDMPHDRFQVFVWVSERDYSNIEKLLQSQAKVNFKFEGTYAGKLVGYGEIQSDWSRLPTSRKGIIQNGGYTTLIFSDVTNSNQLKIAEMNRKLGSLANTNLSNGKINISISEQSNGLGQLQLTLKTSDIENLQLSYTPGIELNSGEFLGIDSVLIQGKSARTLALLLESEGFPVDRGSLHRPGHYPTAWDFVAFGVGPANNRGDNLFHCANFHTDPSSAKCFVRNLRIK